MSGRMNIQPLGLLLGIVSQTIWGGGLDAVPIAPSGAAPAWHLQPPVVGRMSSGFGARHHPLLGAIRHHDGLDIAALQGERVHAVLEGKVVWSGWRGGYGNMVEVDHGLGWRSRYAHLSKISVPTGQVVAAGQTLGLVGSTGLSTGPHLHLEISYGDAIINPLLLFAAERTVVADANSGR